MALKRLIKKIVPTGAFKKVAPLGHLLEAIYYQKYYNFPAKNLKVIGVTGTDGKSTTCALIAQMLRHNKYKVAMITTISVDYGDGKGEQPNPTRLTSLSAKELAPILHKIKEAGAEYLVLETTSHALAQHRVYGVPFSIAVFTNLSHEHLDYHGTFQAYRDAKRLLFKQTNSNTNGLRLGVINADDESASYFKRDVKHAVTYGIKHGDVVAKEIKSDESSSKYSCEINKEKVEITCNLPGSFNVYNSLAAACVGSALGLTTKQIEEGIKSLQSVTGRMTSINIGQNFNVIVDYAHTPESFEKIFKEIKPLAKKRIIAVFGSGGRRDVEKRYAQGEIAGKYADVIIATEEDDRDEDGLTILEQIAKGAEKSGKILGEDLFLVHKREDAISRAVSMAKSGDTVILLGKGHERSILSNGPMAAQFRQLPQDDSDKRRVVSRQYSEIDTVTKAIKDLKK